MDMITSLAQHIAVFLLKNEIIDSENLDIYIYGFEIIISSVISILTGLIFGITFSQLLECTFFFFNSVYSNEELLWWVSCQYIFKM